jgi:predicted RND superfamily exporter protein
MLDRLTRITIRARRLILILFLVGGIAGVFLSGLVDINYKLIDYLPKDAPSTQGLELMQQEFGSRLPNARVMLSEVSIQETLAIKAQLKALDGVSQVIWLDDVIGLNTLTSVPLEFLDPDVIEPYYRNEIALLSLTIRAGQEKETAAAIYAIIGATNAADGEAFGAAETQSMSVSEVLNAMLILVPIIIVILLLSTMSWIEPLFFLLSIGFAILLNMGTNVMFDNVSFITRTVSPVLQLAVSLDYAIFLLHSFNDHRLEHEPKTAMRLAMKQAFPTVAASAMTTLIGFAALIFMRFGIGADLGLNLLKGVAFSFISVMFFLPALTLLAYPLIDKTKHQSFLPSLKGTSKVLMASRIPFMILALLIVVPAYLAQNQTEFDYGMGAVTAASRVGSDTVAIETAFGKDNPLIILVPRGNPGNEALLAEELDRLPEVDRVVAYVTMVGRAIPTELIDPVILEQFYSANTARFIVYLNTPDEGEQAFDAVERIGTLVETRYPTYAMTGTSATLKDMRDVVSTDTALVNLIAIIGIFLTLLITFRSILLPFVLIFTIESAIWINLSFPYFTDTSISFIGYLILSTVQLGATVDYAIHITNMYLDNRKQASKKDAMRQTLENNLISVVVSATILATAGFILAWTSTNPIIQELGTLLGRGTLLSMGMVSLVLPALLILLDGPIQKTTHRHGFHPEDIKE